MFRREVLPPLEIQRKPPRDRGSMKKGDCDTMKKFLALILTLAMALSVTACGGSDDTADDTADGEGSGTEETADYASMTDDELKAAITTVEGGKLTVATSPDFAPYEFYSIDESTLRSTLKNKGTAEARQVAMYLIRKLTNLSLPDIAKEFGKNHTTVLYALKKVEQELPNSSNGLQDNIRDITSNINSRL